MLNNLLSIVALIFIIWALYDLFTSNEKTAKKYYGPY